VSFEDKIEEEVRAHVELRPHVDRTAERGHDLLGNNQAEADPLGVLLARPLDSAEQLEKLGLVLVGDTDAGVCYAYA